MSELSGKQLRYASDLCRSSSLHLPDTAWSDTRIPSGVIAVFGDGQPDPNFQNKNLKDAQHLCSFLKADETFIPQSYDDLIDTQKKQALRTHLIKKSRTLSFDTTPVAISENLDSSDICNYWESTLRYEIPPADTRDTVSLVGENPATVFESGQVTALEGDKWTDLFLQMHIRYNHTDNTNDSVITVSAVIQSDTEGYLHPPVEAERTYPFVTTTEVDDDDSWKNTLERLEEIKKSWQVPFQDWRAYYEALKTFFDECCSGFVPFDAIGRGVDNGKYSVYWKLVKIDADPIASTRDMVNILLNAANRPQQFPLVNNVISAALGTGKLSLTKCSPYEGMRLHLGQMLSPTKDPYPLDDSQRNALHAALIPGNSIVPIQGPPGTGKTTLLRALVASLYVQAALNEQLPPLIFISAATNQAVTNVITALGDSESEEQAPLTKRWLSLVSDSSLQPGHGWYLPAPTTLKQEPQLAERFPILTAALKENGETSWTPYETPLANRSLCLNESLQYQGIKALKQFCQHEELLGSPLKILASCLKQAHDTMNNLITWSKDYQYAASLQETLPESCRTRNNMDVRAKELCNLRGIANRLKSRQDRHKRLFLWYYVIDTISRVIRRPSSSARLHEALSNLTEKAVRTGIQIDVSDTIDSIIHQLDNEIDRTNHHHNEALTKIKSNIDWLRNFTPSISDSAETLNEHRAIELVAESLTVITQRYNDTRRTASQFVDVCSEKWASALTSTRVSDLNMLDKALDQSLRPLMFHLASRMFECKFVSEYNQKDSEYNQKDDVPLAGWAMIRPCFVATSYKLPKWTNIGESPADVLVVDEAGQMPTHQAGACLASARKCVVLGDVHQLRPVFPLKEEEDNYILAKRFDHAQIPREIKVSAGSMMALAEKATLATTENEYTLLYNYRSRPQIVELCSELAYNGMLQSVRSSPDIEKQPPFPPLALVAASTLLTPRTTQQENDYRVRQNAGKSRYNKGEAKQVCDWLLRNGEELCSFYGGNLADIVAILTPYKAQQELLKGMLVKRKNDFESLGISSDDLKQIKVGTVHVMQGAERPVVLASLVLTRQTSFIDTEMINVMASRAQDSCIIFTDPEVLSSVSQANKESPFPVLTNHLKKNGSLIWPQAIAICESPQKARLIEDTMADTDTPLRCFATMGTFCRMVVPRDDNDNLLVQRLLSEPPTWEWESGEEPYFIVELTSALSSTPPPNTLYLATDADMVGEEIAWQVLRVLKEKNCPLPSIKRVELRDVSAEEIRLAFNSAKNSLNTPRLRAGMVQKIARIVLSETLRNPSGTQRHPFSDAKIGDESLLSLASGILMVSRALHQNEHGSLKEIEAIVESKSDGQVFTTSLVEIDETGEALVPYLTTPELFRIAHWLPLWHYGEPKYRSIEVRVPPPSSGTISVISALTKKIKQQEGVDLSPEYAMWLIEALWMAAEPPSKPNRSL